MNHQDKVNILKARQISRNLFTKNIDNTLSEKPIYIRENLAANGNKLFKEARDFRKQFGFQFVCTKNGIIFLRKNEIEKIICVNNEDTIQNLKSQIEHLNSKN